MASGAIDVSELKSFARDLARAGEAYQKKEKTFMRKEGSKLRSKTKKEARKLGKKTGNYLKSIKRGKVYEYGGAQAVRVYSSAPHAHLIEEGHRMVLHDGTEVGFVPGHHVFEIASKDFEPQFYTDLDDFLDGTLKL